MVTREASSPALLDSSSLHSLQVASIRKQARLASELVASSTSFHSANQLATSLHFVSRNLGLTGAFLLHFYFPNSASALISLLLFGLPQLLLAGIVKLTNACFVRQDAAIVRSVSSLAGSIDFLSLRTHY